MGALLSWRDAFNQRRCLNKCTNGDNLTQKVTYAPPSMEENTVSWSRLVGLAGWVNTNIVPVASTVMAPSTIGSGSDGGKYLQSKFGHDTTRTFRVQSAHDKEEKHKMETLLSWRGCVQTFQAGAKTAEIDPKIHARRGE